MSPEPRALSTLPWAVRGEGTQGRGDTGELRTEALHLLKVPQELQGTSISVCRMLGSALKYGPVEEGTQQLLWHSQRADSREEMEKGFRYCLLSKNSAV